MGLCPRCRTSNPDPAAYCRKCGVQLAPAQQPAPAPAPQIVYVDRPAPPQRVEIVHKYKKRNGIGCGLIILILLIGCCLWGSFFRAEESKPAQPTPAPAPTPSDPVPSAGPFQLPPIQERQEYDQRVVAKVNSLVADRTIQVYFAQRTVYFNPQAWRSLTPVEKKAEWETFREYFRIKTGSRDVRILSSIDGEDLGREVQ